MNVALHQRRMSQSEFFSWAQAQDARYEFDGFGPVAMTGGTLSHNQITLNIHAALRSRLSGSRCQAFGADAGLATVGDAVRYPDALITCGKVDGEAYVVAGVVVVFEVISKTSGRVDRIEKVSEYQQVPTILRYVIVERTSIGAMVFERARGDMPWTARTLREGGVLGIPEVGIEVPLVEYYEGTGLVGADDAGSVEGEAMNVALHRRRMSQSEFFSWAQVQDVRYEFDGFGPVAMTGGSFSHSRITVNILGALRDRLRGSGCQGIGPDAGLATVGGAVRYPDALITCSAVEDDAAVIPGVVVVFEVISKTSGRVDRIEKVSEYQQVSTILRYVIVERTSVGATVFERARGDMPWMARTLRERGVLGIPEVGIEVPLVELYEGTGVVEGPGEAGAGVADE